MDSDSSANNKALNRQLQLTGKLCSLPYYRKSITCTPVHTIQDSCICYSYDLKLFICTICSRVQNPDATFRHLKQQHRPERDRLKKTIKAIQEEIDSLPTNSVQEIAITHNKFYFSCLPVTFNNFKCRECGYVDINRKNVRNHFQANHPPTIQSINQKVDYVLEDIPLQVLEGFSKNKKIYFIPRLPDIPTNTLRAHNEDVYDRPTTLPHVFSDKDRALIIGAHQKSIEDRENKQSYNDAATHNKKLLDTFLTNSNVLGFLEGKDRDVLVALVSSSSTINLEAEKGLDLELLETTALTFMVEVHEYVPNLTRRFRQLLKTENQSKTYKQMKDFIQLAAPEPHLKRYCRLLTFLIRVRLIRRDYKHHASDTIKSKYFDITEHIHLSDETMSLIDKLIGLGIRPIQDDVEQQYTLALRGIVFRIFHSLLQDPIHLTIKQNATFKNPVIYFYFCSILRPQTNEIANISLVSKIASIFVYNARLLFLAYYYDTEDRRLLQEDAMNRMYEKEIKKYLSNDSKNYFEELTQIRAYSLDQAKRYKSTTYTIKESPAGVLQFNGVPYPIEHIKNFFIHLGVQLEGQLKSKLLFVDHLGSLGIDFNKIEDTPLLNKTGQSILDTPQLGRFKSWFLDELLAKDSAYNRFFVRDVHDGQIRFKQSNVQRFLADLNIFTELLANAINLYSGGPLRGTELNLILYKNTSIKDRSMLYNQDAEMFFVTTDYNKTKNITRRDRHSHRYIIPMLSRIIIVYVAAVLPLRDYIYRRHYQDDAFDNPYLLAKAQGSISSYSISMRLQKESARCFRIGLSLQSWRKMINFIIKTKMHASPLDPDSSSDSSDAGDLVEDKQANRTTQVSFNHYFNSEYLVNSTATPKELNALREFSIRYFNYFHLLDDFSCVRHNQKTTGIMPPAEEVEMVTLDNKGLLQSLRRLYRDPQANFINNEQRSCVSQVLSGRPYITYINRTGSGKSLVYLLPAFMKRDHLYVIITPRLALKEDLYRRACDLKLRPSRFEDPVTYHSTLVFCSVEDLDSQELKKFIERHKAFGRDVTIMLDEAHLFLIEVTFRLQLRDLISILQFKANIVFITATLPQPLLFLLNKTFGISNFNSIIRGNSNRSDISYRRVYYRTREDREDTVRNIVKGIEQEDTDVRNKILIFVTNKKQGGDLAKLLHSELVYSGKEDLLCILQDLVESKTQRTLITTSVLEVGIDIKQIKYTISVEPIYSLTSVIQSSGRIRQRGVSYVVCQEPTRNSRSQMQREGGARWEVEKIEDFNELDKAWYGLLKIEATCLRTPISQFLDRVPYRCQGHKDDLCSLCVENDRVKEERRAREEGEFQERRIQWLELEERLLTLKEMYCMYCMLDPYNTGNGINHSSLECQRLRQDETMLGLQKRVRAELQRQGLPGHECGCFRCLIPKNICAKQQENNGLEEDACLMSSFVGDTMAVVFRFQRVVEGLIKGLPNPTEELGRFVREMMAPSNWSTLKTVRVIEVLGQVDVVQLVEDLERESERAWVGERGRGEGAAGRETELDLTVASPEGGWDGTEGWETLAAEGAEAGRVGESGGRRRASARLSEVFAEERGGRQRRGELTLQKG